VSYSELSRCVQSLGKLRRIDRIDRVKYFGSLYGFVGLEMANHVEFGVVKIHHSSCLVRKFLHTILAEQAMTSSVGFEDAFDGKVLLTAISATSSRFRPARLAARAMRSWMAERLVAMDIDSCQLSDLNLQCSSRASSGRYPLGRERAVVALTVHCFHNAEYRGC